MYRRSALTFFIVFGWLNIVVPASAQDLACPNFSSDQAAAQAYFEAGGGTATNNYNGLDSDGNGVACDEPGAFEGGGPSAGASTCVTFAGDQAAAQEWFEANGGSASNDYQRMDTNHNGIACDEPGIFESGGPSAGPESCADFATQAEAQTYFENGGATAGDDVLNLDADGNGVACDESETVGLEDSTVVVSALPSTGSGAVLDSGASIASIVGAVSMLLAGAAMLVRRSSMSVG